MNYTLSDMTVDFPSIGRHIGIVFMHQTRVSYFFNYFKNINYASTEYAK